MTAQIGLSLTRSKTPKADFLVTRLILTSITRNKKVYLPGNTLNEPAHEIMALFVLCKLILQTHMRSHPAGLDFWFLVRPFTYFHTSCVRTAKALVRLRGCAGSPVPSLVAYVISIIISRDGSDCSSEENGTIHEKQLWWNIRILNDCEVQIISTSRVTFSIPWQTLWCWRVKLSWVMENSIHTEKL